MYHVVMETNIDKHIEFRAKRDGRMRPFVAGTRVEVQHIVTDSEVHNMEAEEIAAGYPHVPLAAIFAALAFYHDNRDEVRQMIREDEEIVRKFQLQQSPTGIADQGSPDGASPISS